MPLRTLVQPLLPLQRSVHESSLNPKSYTLNPKATATLCLGEQRGQHHYALALVRYALALARMLIAPLARVPSAPTPCVERVFFLFCRSTKRTGPHVYMRGAINEDLTPLIERAVLCCCRSTKRTDGMCIYAGQTTRTSRL